MQLIRANTQVKVVIGPVVAVANGYVPVTTLALNTADEAEIMKHDASSVTDISGATFAAITSADGYYNLTLTTSHTDTEGLLTVLINDDSLCLPVKQTFMVLAEAAWDSMFVAKDDGFMDVNIKTLNRTDTQETEAANLEAACAAYSATRGLSGTALPAAAADAPGGLIISDAGGLDADAQRSDVAAILVDTGTTLQGELDGIQADTEDIQTRLPAALVSGRMDSTLGGAISISSFTVSGNFSVGGVISAVTNTMAWSSNWNTDAQAAAQAALVANGLDHLFVGADPGGLVVNNSLWAKLVSKSATAAFSDYDNTTDSLQAAADAATTNYSALVNNIDGVDAKIDIIDGIVDTIVARVIGTLASGTHNPQTGDAYARLGAPAGASVSADIAAVKSETATIESRGDRVVARCTVGSASSTTSIVTSACSPSGAVADQFKGRIVVFDKATTTAALRGQATDITASTSSATPTMTVTALTTAPASGDTFSIV